MQQLDVAVANDVRVTEYDRAVEEIISPSFLTVHIPVEFFLYMLISFSNGSPS
jgi:hypothetical protein